MESSVSEAFERSIEGVGKRGELNIFENIIMDNRTAYPHSPILVDEVFTNIEEKLNS